MSAISICASLLIAFTKLVLCRTRKAPQIAAYGSQTMCPSCGLITSRIEECCLECRQPLRTVQAIMTVEK